MKTIFNLILSILISTTSIAQIEKNALFIGNSYTYVNDLPGIIQEIALSKGNIFSHQSHTPGGATLALHASNSTVQNLLNVEEWDFVILQDQSQNPSFPPSQVASQVYPYAASLCDDIRQVNTCTNPVFFMTWGRENGDAQNCVFYPPLCTYEGMQDRLRESYTEMAVDNNALLAPVGTAWKNIRANYPNIDLYSSDGSHPSIHGSYLAACVFYSVLFNESPINAFVPTNISSADALILQETAFNTTQENEIDFSQTPEAIANYQLIGDSIYFYNQSQNFNSIQWIGISQNIVSDADPLIVNIGDFTGIYEIELQVSDDCTESSVIIQINDLALKDLETRESIFPNPTTGILNYSGGNNLAQSILVYNTLGVCVYKNEENKNTKWDFSYFPEGIYSIELKSKNEKTIQLNWIKKN
tara:strand:+ start:2288 stop:3532 length:1245 start_codon:yes stop_codon:yes gene_type:complete